MNDTKKCPFQRGEVVSKGWCKYHRNIEHCGKYKCVTNLQEYSEHEKKKGTKKHYV